MACTGLGRSSRSRCRRTCGLATLSAGKSCCRSAPRPKSATRPRHLKMTFWIRPAGAAANITRGSEVKNALAALCVVRKNFSFLPFYEATTYFFVLGLCV